VIHPELKGKPLITGGERGIVACASYAAKKMGIKRAVPLKEARKICPGLIILPSDYETYSLFSRRMFSIMRRFTLTWRNVRLTKLSPTSPACAAPCTPLMKKSRSR